jgi:hypothetical protein
MKYLKKYILTLAMGVALVTSCSKDELEDLNTDPQSLSTINLNFLFTSAQLGAPSGGSRADNRYMELRSHVELCGYAIQHLASAQPIHGDKYFDNADATSLPFDFVYSDLKNLGEILKQSGPGGFAEGEYANLREATRVLRVLLFQRLTDFYGAVPYFESIKASESVFFPAYDKQSAIYTDMLKELDEAATNLAPATGDGFAEADLYYQGDIMKWKKFAYSLMLRLAMRVSNVNSDLADTYVAKAVAGGLFSGNEDNVIVPMNIGPNPWVNQNGRSRVFFPGDEGHEAILSKTLIDFLKGTNGASTADDDPRLMIITAGIGTWTATSEGGAEFNATNTDPLDQKGMPNGLTLSDLQILENDPALDINSTYSKLNPRLLDKDEDYMLMNYGETQLLLAEAAQRSIGGLSPATAATYYAEGVKASMQMMETYDASFTVSDGAVTDYLAAHPYGIAKPAETMIQEQLWVNHFLNWYEVWSNWRRTGLPELVPTNAPGNVTNGTIPQKLKYPNAEVAGNPSFLEGGSANNYTTKVWWAGGPE